MLSELEFEDKLLRELVNGESQWTLREDIKTEEALWQNIRQKIEQNNVDKLNEVPLTDKEFEQIKNKLTFTSFYEAGRFLVGENGSVKVEVIREDASLGRVYLEVINQREISGGRSSYEVIHQLQVAPRLPHHQARRLDVTLLINGLPLIQIELKKANVSRNEAFNQLNKYLSEAIFTGPLSMMQMFVVMNERGAEYISAPKRGQKLNRQFLTGWLDPHNQPVHDGLLFAKEVLSIPQAHKMVAEYMVLDEQSQALILLRPYQIQAIEQVRNASRKGQSGYVWHTTGSGKTITSYNVARNLLKIPSVDKTIFLVDRRDLDDQTFSAFSAYAENDFIDIDATDYTDMLKKKLLSKERSVIVTTRQKLNNIMTEVKEGKIKERDAQVLRHLKLAFVVDECHRTISSERKKELACFFKDSLWYGFTGTPIFEQNKKSVKGNLAATTKEQYGPCLHKYTVKEAIHDHAVLGFKVDYQETFDEDWRSEIFKRHNIEVDMNDEQAVEQAIPKQYFEQDKHKLAVINAIINHSLTPFGFYQKNKKNGDYYAAILTVSSIKEAQRYYELFQEVIADQNETVKVSQKVKRYAPDFPKVAITYSVSENEEDSSVNQEKMRQAIADYNALFDCHYEISQLGAYNRNLNDRLARKKKQYQNRKEQLDLVIVVDRLLTGFDAPCISTLFIDRAPQKPQELIQAFSRTNRIFDDGKPYGNIKIFRTPHLYKEKVDQALRLYSNGGEESVLAPTWDEAKARFEKATGDFLSHVPAPEKVIQSCQTLTQQKAFASYYQKMVRAKEHLVVYDEYKDYHLEETLGLTEDVLEAYHMSYLTIMEEIRKTEGGGTAPDDDPDDFVVDLEYEVTRVHQEEINYEYIIRLIQEIVSSKEELPLIMEKQKSEVEENIQSLHKGKPQLAEFVLELWEDILAHPYDYAEVDIQRLLSTKIAEKEEGYIHECATRWQVSPHTVYQAIDYYDEEQEKSSQEMKDLLKEAWTQYKVQEEKKLNRLKLNKKIRAEFQHLIEKIEELR